MCARWDSGLTSVRVPRGTPGHARLGFREGDDLMGKKKKTRRKGHSRNSPSRPTPKPAAKPEDGVPDHERRAKLIYVQPPKSSKGKSGNAPAGATAPRATRHRI